ncbi:hypothetical protein SORBI_3001G048600 [Sorghum bicolor]|uniref:Rieske domain-containing protein n=1 Tax=Sorghum bicolor TaxID=4558 RepID=A0A1B6QHD6_SORBI|nr:hypothetical protein SORBI_3001G048600 [Sorghum bicolor]
MELLSLHFLHPRTGRPSLPLAAAAPSNTRRPQSRTYLLAPPRRTRGAPRLSVSAVAAEKPRAEEAPPSPSKTEAFDWLDQWYPIAPVCDLDPRAPHGKVVLGLSVVAWYDRGAGEWRVFEDACPHRLAPLSQGRIDGKGRLQCAYHGWCFDGAGACAFIPQAPALGPPVHENRRACVASYPCVVQNNILWFYPRTEAEHRDVLRRKRPPYFAEIDDPSYFTTFGMRDVSVGYDVAVDNIFDIAHVPYAHKGLLPYFRDEEDPGRYHDQECGEPIKMEIEHADVHGFLSKMKGGSIRFVAPCTFHGTPASTKVAAGGEAAVWFMLVALIIPVAPGRSRVIWAFPRNAGVWLHKLIPRWFFHSVTNRVIDSDVCLMHVEERKFAAAGLENWHRSCYVPTSSDGMVVAFRDWFRKHCNHQVGWGAPQPDHQLPPSSTKDHLLERYWSHVAQCTSCSAALRSMRLLEVALQVMSVSVIGSLAVAKGSSLLTSVVQRAVVVTAAVLCFMASRWLATYIEKNFYFQDFIHSYN